MHASTPMLSALHKLATRHPALWSWVLLFVCVLAFVPAGHMQTRMAIGQLYAAADICLASQHGVARAQSRSGLNGVSARQVGSDQSSGHSPDHSSGHHCAACLPALDHGVRVFNPAYATWAEQLSHQPRQRDIPRQAVSVLPRPPGQAPPSLLV